MIHSYEYLKICFKKWYSEFRKLDLNPNSFVNLILNSNGLVNYLLINEVVSHIIFIKFRLNNHFTISHIPSKRPDDRYWFPRIYINDNIFYYTLLFLYNFEFPPFDHVLIFHYFFCIKCMKVCILHFKQTVKFLHLILQNNLLTIFRKIFDQICNNFACLVQKPTQVLANYIPTKIR